MLPEGFSYINQILDYTSAREFIPPSLYTSSLQRL